VQLREQIQEALRERPLNIIELSIVLQRNAGIPEMTQRELNGGYNRAPEHLAGPAAQRATSNLAEAIRRRFDLLCDSGYTLSNLLRVLRSDRRFEMVIENVSISVDDEDGSRPRRVVQVKKWRNRE
jgi:hypothetical protein